MFNINSKDNSEGYDFLWLQHLGDDASIINDIVSGKHPLSKRLENAQKPVIIVGVDQLARPDGEAILTALYEYGKKLSKSVSFEPWSKFMDRSF